MHHAAQRQLKIQHSKNVELDVNWNELRGGCKSKLNIECGHQRIVNEVGYLFSEIERLNYFPISVQNLMIS